MEMVEMVEMVEMEMVERQASSMEDIDNSVLGLIHLDLAKWRLRW